MTKEEKKAVKTATQLPEPCGYKILLTLPEVDTKTAGGVIKPDSVVAIEETATVVGFVTKMGPDCYKDENRFPSGPYCKEGDFVLVRAFQGTRVKIHGSEFRMINDDNVEAVVDDPRGYERA